MSKKPIIVFEGIEGSGKSHHINKVSKYLDKKKISYIKIREPGGSINSEKIRRLILNKKSNFNIHTDLLLYLAARSENINLLKKSYKKKIILIDRFVDSTIAYQHYGFKINKKVIKELNNFILGNLKPNFTFFHYVPIKRIKKNISGKKNKYDSFSKNFYNNVQNGFLNILKKNKNKLLIDSSKNKKYNIELIKNRINKILKING